MLCAVPPKQEQLLPWGMTIAFAWTSVDPLKIGGEAVFCRPDGAGHSSVQWAPAQSPGWQNMQGLWPETSKLRYISVWRKFLKQEKTTSALKKEKKKSLLCTFMCLGNQEIPHYCSLDILRSFTSTGHETGPRIIHKSVFKAKCVRRDIDENVPKLTCHSGRKWLHSCLEWHARKSVLHVYVHLSLLYSQLTRSMDDSPRLHRTRTVLCVGVLGSEFCKQAENKWTHALCLKSSIRHRYP